MTVPVPWPPALGGVSVLRGRRAASLALFEKVPLPAPSFRRSREVFACSPAQVNDGEDAVVAGEQMRGQGSGLCPPRRPQAPEDQATPADHSGLSHNILPRPSRVLMAVTCPLFMPFPWFQPLRVPRCRSDTETRGPS